MVTRRLLLVSFVLLAAGVGLLAGYCNGSASLSSDLASPGAILKLDIATVGMAVTAGVPLTIVGASLLSIAAICAVLGEIRSTFFQPKPALAEPPEVAYPEDPTAP